MMMLRWWCLPVCLSVSPFLLSFPVTLQTHPLRMPLPLPGSRVMRCGVSSYCLPRSPGSGPRPTAAAELRRTSSCSSMWSRRSMSFMPSSSSSSPSSGEVFCSWHNIIIIFSSSSSKVIIITMGNQSSDHIYLFLSCGSCSSPAPELCK